MGCSPPLIYHRSSIGAVLAYNSGRTTDVNNERYLANIQQALDDINSGYAVLNPPLPAGAFNN
jgi:hypothetical protein